MRPRWRPLSVRTRLTLWYTGALLAILIVVAGLSYSVLKWNLLQDVDRSLLTVAEVVATATDAMGATEAEGRGLFGRDLGDELVQVRSPEGAVHFRSAHLREHALPLSPQTSRRLDSGKPAFETVPLARREVRLVSLPVTRLGRMARIIQVAVPLGAIEHALRQYLVTMVVLVPLGVLMAAFGGALMAQAALRPVDEMSQSARRITAERLERRIAVEGTGDELDRLAETLNGMLARLEAAFQELRRLSADAAHELRTPLTALKGGLEVALRADRSPGEYRKVLQASLEEVERLIRLAEDMLLLSRSTAGLETSQSPVDLEPLALDVLDVGTQLARGGGVAVRLTETAAAMVRGDPTALRRAMLNLVENAVKYTPPGGHVELSLRGDNGTAAFTVRDTGPGIPAADAERVFEPFVRLDDARARNTGGAGLGLAIARSIVIAHGGSLNLEGGPGKGSSFTIRLPSA